MRMYDLFLLALDDADKFEAAGHKLKMETWLAKGDHDGTCVGCLAGAVVSCRLRVSFATIHTVEDSWGNLMGAIDELRKGEILEAFDYYGMFPTCSEYVAVGEYMGDLAVYDGVLKALALDEQVINDELLPKELR